MRTPFVPDLDEEWDFRPLTRIKHSDNGGYLLEYLERSIEEVQRNLRLTDPNTIGTVGILQGMLCVLCNQKEVLLAEEKPESEIDPISLAI